MEVLISIVCIAVVCSFVYKICLCLLKIEPITDNTRDFNNI